MVAFEQGLFEQGLFELSRAAAASDSTALRAFGQTAFDGFREGTDRQLQAMDAIASYCNRRSPG